MKEIHRGAEAVILKDNDEIVKQRIPKPYRLRELDEDLRSSRTKREAKVLKKLKNKGIPAPRLLETNDYGIRMEFIDGKRLADIPVKEHMEKVGEVVAMLHDANIAHGDLTTSNMILKDDIYLIDFGLSFFSTREEDKAVDIHLLKEALEAKHYEECKEAFEAFRQGYKNSPTSKDVMKRLEKVEKRGRNKGK